MRDMTPAEARQFLMDKPRTAKVATVRPDGRPHVAPVWIALDGDDLLFTTWYETVKAANLKANPQLSLCVDDEAPPFSYVIVEGVAEIDENPDPAEMLRWTTEIAGRYMGADKAEAFGKRNAVAGEWLIRVKVSKIIAKAGVAD